MADTPQSDKAATKGVGQGAPSNASQQLSKKPTTDRVVQDDEPETQEETDRREGEAARLNRENTDREGRETREREEAERKRDAKVYDNSMKRARSISDSNGNEEPHDENDEAANKLLSDGNAYVTTKQRGLEVIKTIHLSEKGASELASYKSS